jgi:CubicO group peptidase (beta-lactamase class C family)
LFDRIGMSRATWERDQAGTFVGSSYLYATPRDLAKFGYLYLHDGQWAGERILAEGWVDYTRTLAPAWSTMPLTEEDKEDNPGAHWWLNKGLPERQVPPPWPDAPADTFAALGHWGQSIFVIPSLDLVIVRTADDRDGTFKKNTLLKLITDSIRKS